MVYFNKSELWLANLPAPILKYYFINKTLTDEILGWKVLNALIFSSFNSKTDFKCTPNKPVRGST